MPEFDNCNTSENITELFPKKAASDPDHVLEQAKGHYDQVFIIGYNKDGALSARCSTNINQQGLNWMLDKFKLNMLNGEYSK